MSAWIIDTDHLADDGEKGDAGLTGPGNATGAELEALSAGKGLQWKMYDDDGILYYTGRSIGLPVELGTEEFCAQPLDNYGAPGAGCVLIKWTNHPEWNIG